MNGCEYMKCTDWDGEKCNMPDDFCKYDPDSEAAYLGESGLTTGYIALTFEQHPLTGEAVPVLKSINRNTTIGELVDWYKEKFPNAKQLYDLKITEAI